MNRFCINFRLGSYWITRAYLNAPPSYNVRSFVHGYYNTAGSSRKNKSRGYEGKLHIHVVTLILRSLVMRFPAAMFDMLFSLDCPSSEHLAQLAA
jgi:hypothetical protein